MFENNTLYSKLEKLENVWIGFKIQREGLRSIHSNKLSFNHTALTLLLKTTELNKNIVTSWGEEAWPKLTLLIQRKKQRRSWNHRSPTLGLRQEALNQIEQQLVTETSWILKEKGRELMEVISKVSQSNRWSLFIDLFCVQL